MDDFHHSRGFIASSGLSGQHGKAGRGSAIRRKVAGGLAKSPACNTVRQDADFQPRTVNAKGAARLQRGE